MSMLLIASRGAPGSWRRDASAICVCAGAVAPPGKENEQFGRGAAIGATAPVCGCGISGGGGADATTSGKENEQLGRGGPTGMVTFELRWGDTRGRSWGAFGEVVDEEYGCRVRVLAAEEVITATPAFCGAVRV